MVTYDIKKLDCIKSCSKTHGEGASQSEKERGSFFRWKGTEKKDEAS